MERFFILIGIIVLVITEAILTIIELRKIDKRIDFFNEFNNKFVHYCNSNGNDVESYSWLVNRSEKMQREMGYHGIADYRPSFANYYIKNYQMIVNGLSAIRQEFQVGFGSDNAPLISESLIRYSGWLYDYYEEQRKSLFNPLVLLKDGIKRIISIPLMIFSQLGIISLKSMQTLKGNYFFNLISAIITILGVISAIITIVAGWDTLIKLLSRLPI